MALATFWATTNNIGIDPTSVYSGSAVTAGTWAENVQPAPPFLAGTVAWATNGSAAVYVTLGTGGVTGTGYAILMPSAAPYTAAVMMSNSVGLLGDKIGFWLGSTAANSGDSGWVLVYGYNPTGVQTAASVAANTALTSSATAGQLATGGTHNLGNIFLTTAAGGSAGRTATELNWPTVTS